MLSCSSHQKFVDFSSSTTITTLISHILYQYVQATPVQEVNSQDALEVEEKAYPPSATQKKKDARPRQVRCVALKFVSVVVSAIVYTWEKIIILRLKSKYTSFLKNICFFFRDRFFSSVSGGSESLHFMFKVNGARCWCLLLTW